KRGKPLFIVSCGVQGPVGNFIHDFSLWRDPLNYASFVTVRSKKDKELLGLLTNSFKIHYFRDIGYIYPHIFRAHTVGPKTITLIIAGPVHDKNETILKYIKNSKNKNIVIMNMGSLKDDNYN